MNRLVYAALFAATPLSAMAGDLDGIWIGDQGRKVIVAGSEYRRCVGTNTADGGKLAYNDHLLRTKSAHTQKVTEFVYGFDGGRLLLMAPTGELSRYTKASADAGFVEVCPPSYSMAVNASSETDTQETVVVASSGS